MKQIILLSTLLLNVAALHSQEALWDRPNVQSPLVNPNSTVTITVHAPDANRISVVGLGEDTLELSKSENGVWSATSSRLKPDLYIYYLIADGIRITDPSNPYIARDISSLYNEVIVPGGNADLYRVTDVPHGTVSKEWYPSPTLGMSRRLTVYTPAGYEDSISRSYPVFYLLHGMGGDEDAWNELGQASAVLDNLIASGKVEPMIVVMPNGNAELAAAPGYTQAGMYTPLAEHSVAEQGKFESSFPDIINYIDHHYRTIPDKAHRAIAGLSMGGGHAWRTSMMFPDTFDYVGLFSAAVRWNGTGVGQSDESLDNPLRRQFANTPKLYWIGIGDKDFLYDINVEYRTLLDSLDLPYEYHESSGGHTWNNWRDYLVIFSQRLFK